MSDQHGFEDLFTREGDPVDDVWKVDAKGDLIPAKVRTYIYGLVQPVGALLSFYGIVADEALPLWAGLATAVLGGGVAIAYRPTR